MPEPVEGDLHLDIRPECPECSVTFPTVAAMIVHYEEEHCG